MKGLLVRTALAALLVAGCESAPPSKTEEPTAAATPPAPAPAPEARPAPGAAPPAPAPPPPAPPSPVVQDPGRPAPADLTRTLFIKTTYANFREGPGTTAKILAVLRKSTRLEVLEERNHWFRVKLADGREGWVAESVTGPTPE